MERDDGTAAKFLDKRRTLGADSMRLIKAQFPAALFFKAEDIAAHEDSIRFTGRYPTVASDIGAML